MKLLLLALVLPLSAQAPTWDQGKFFELMNAQDDFYRTLVGCPARGYPPAITCLPSAGKFDVKLWHRFYALGHDFFKGN